MQPQRTRRPASTTWEEDILALRGLELLFVLFYIEDIKRSVLSSIRTTDRVMKRADRFGPEHVHSGGLFEIARDILVSEQVISQTDGEELLSLLDYGNAIGHGLPQLMADIGSFPALIQFRPGGGPPNDYAPVLRLKAMRKRVLQRMKQRFVPPNSLDVMHFENAEQVFQKEIARFKKRVSTGLKQRRDGMA
jgi:hypothetical protein